MHSIAIVWASIASASLAAAQCPTGAGPFHPRGFDGDVWGVAHFDDGTGMALYAAGEFQHVGTISAPGIARWDGTTWTALPSGVNGLIKTLAAFDDGSGVALYAGGTFDQAGSLTTRGIARWNGSSWSAVGGGIDDTTPFSLNDMAIFDDGSGPALFVTGRFDRIGGTLVYGTAKWTGSVWQNCGGGIGGNAGYALEVWNDGTGPGLFVAGDFFNAGPMAANHIAKWSSTGWHTLGGGFGSASDVVYGLRAFDDGGGAQLYAVGKLGSAGGVAVNNVARWNGSTWSAVGAGISNPIHPLEIARSVEVFDDGSGAKLYVGGPFNTPSLHGIATWNGSTWSTAAGGVDRLTIVPDVRVMHIYDDGGGDALFVGGEFFSAGATQAQSLARLRAGAWSAVESGEGVGGVCAAFATHPTLGGGPALYAGGTWKVAGPVFSQGVARWDGTSWSALGAGLSGSGLAGTGMPGYGLALLARDEPGGPALYVGGEFQQAGGVAARAIARWNGATWSALGAGPGDAVFALTEFDDGAGAALYAGGANGWPPPSNLTPMLAKWNGTSWTQIPGLDALPNPYGNVAALAVFDSGSGPELYVAGAFAHAGGIASRGIARWSASGWSDVGGPGMGGTLSFEGVGSELAVFDDGGGPQLYVGGTFQSINGQAITNLARWNGLTWSPVGTSGASAIVSALAVHDDGTGAALYAGGSFSSIGGVAANSIARWDGSNWSALGAGSSGGIAALCSAWLPNYPYPSLFIGGSFSEFDGRRCGAIARWSNTCACAPTNYCTAGTTTNGCNAHIVGTGTPSASAPSGFVLDVVGVEGNKPGLVFYGINGRLSNPWGLGSTSFLCVKAPTQRTTFQFPGGTTGQCDGVLTLDWNAWVATHPGTLGAPFSVGQIVDAQGWFRDPPAPKTTNLSDALEFSVCP